MGYLKAAETFNVPRSTLLDYVKSANSEELIHKITLTITSSEFILQESFFGKNPSDFHLPSYIKTHTL
jgi:hypothetical protein